jgi:hypothetical protein
MSPVLNYALPAMGICRNLPRDVVFSSTQYCGIGVKHIHTLQEITRLKDILHHTYLKLTTDQLYCTSLEYLILEVGMGINLADIPYDKYQHLATNCLLKSTWEFLSNHNINLQHDITVPKNTSYDYPIMPEFCKYNPTLPELIALNRCRLYLQAFYLSDLASASGQRLSYHAWEGRRRASGHTSRFNWPNQGMPCKQS